MVTTVTPDTSIHEVLQKMQSNFIKHIVVEEKNKPVGVVTERDINKYLENDKTARTLEAISIEQVMEKNLILITDGASDHLNRAAERMDVFKIGSVILVDSNGNLAGIITKTDITKVYGAVYGGKFKVKDYMSRKVFTCRKSDSLRFALNMINQNDVSRLVVTDNNGKPHGVITTNDFLIHSSYFTKDKTETREYLLPVDSKNMCVDDLVSDELLAVNLEDDLSIVAQKMIKNHIHGIPVIDDNDNLVGIVSNLDVVRAFVKVPLTEDLLQKYSKLY
ncbi:MAG: CBS domain-containing protein [Nitrosopumilus sp.]|nr:CBS domain-containing protein [Nitrosopumilus sp.]